MGKKFSLEWSNRFDHGYCQIIDWFWKLSDLAKTHAAKAIFGQIPFNYYGLLVIGRSEGLEHLEQQRLDR